MNLFFAAVGLSVLCYVCCVQGFDLKEFVKSYCTLESHRRERVELKCSNFKFSESVIDDIQSNDFIITNLTRVHFQNCDIGIVNDNFLAKFPHVEEFRFNNVIFTTSPPTRGFVLPSPLKVVDLVISEGRMTHTQNCNFLSAMPDLEYVHLGSIDVNFKTMDANFFQNNPKITWITLKNLSIVSFEEGIFDTLGELDGVYIYEVKLGFLPRALFTKNTKLKKVLLDHCSLDKVPELSYPKSLNTVSLSYNNITVITASSFKNMENVTTLKLNNNNIENFWLEVLDELKNLTAVDLSYNRITEISKDHFWRLEEMSFIDLRFNDIETTDLEEFVNVNVMLHPSRREEKEQEEDDDEHEAHGCGCGHAWAVLFLFLGIFGGGMGFIAWSSSVTRLKRVFGYKMNRMDEDNRNLL